MNRYYAAAIAIVIICYIALGISSYIQGGFAMGFFMILNTAIAFMVIMGSLMWLLDKGSKYTKEKNEN